MAPQLHVVHGRLRQIPGLLKMELDEPGANIGPPYVDGEDCVMAVQHPAGQQVRGSDQPRFVGMVADGPQLRPDILRRQNYSGARNGQLSHAAAAEAAAHDDALYVPPPLEAQKPPDHTCKLLRERLDRAVHNCSRFRIAFGEDLAEPLLAQGLVACVAQRIVACGAQCLPHAFEDIPERALARLVADEALLVFDLEVVAFDLDAGEGRGAMRGQGRLLGWPLASEFFHLGTAAPTTPQVDLASPLARFRSSRARKARNCRSSCSISSSVQLSRSMNRLRALCRLLSSSSSLRWRARASWFCVFWSRNTIRKVTTVVPVLITSCQVS